MNRSLQIILIASLDTGIGVSPCYFGVSFVALDESNSIFSLNLSDNLNALCLVKLVLRLTFLYDLLLAFICLLFVTSNLNCVWYFRLLQ